MNGRTACCLPYSYVHLSQVPGEACLSVGDMKVVRSTVCRSVTSAANLSRSYTNGVNKVQSVQHIPSAALSLLLFV